MNISNIDIKFSAFLKENEEKIKKVTPVNPTIKADDEWRDKSYDVFYEQHKKEKQNK